MSEQIPMDFQELTLSAGDSHARTFPWLEIVKGWLESRAAYGGSFLGWSGKYGRLGSLSKMSLVSYLRMRVRTLTSSSQVLPNVGMVWRGACWTANISEYPSDGVESSLSDVLQPHAPRKYCLSPKAAMGILRRSEKRGRKFPEHLAAALIAVAGEMTLTEPELSFQCKPAHCSADREMTGETNHPKTYIVNARQDPIVGKQPLDCDGNSLAIAIRTAQISSNGWGIGTDGKAYTLDKSEGQAVVFPTILASRAGTARPGGPRLASEHEYCVVSSTPDPNRMREASGVSRRVDTPDGPRYAALGDAVTVPVIEWIGRRILRFA